MKSSYKNNSDIYKRSYYGSLVVLFFFFMIFLLKTSICSGTENGFNSDDSSRISNNTEEIKLYKNNSDSVSKKDDISNKSTQKNKIKDLTVNKKLVNINTASVNELIELKGIGKKTAGEIIKYRNENGIFKTVEELMKVKGIGIKKYSEISDNIILK